MEERLPLEVKGWGEPLTRRDDEFTYDADINAEQHAQACRDPNWEISRRYTLGPERSSGSH
jgi:hypothetical protein